MLRYLCIGFLLLCAIEPCAAADGLPGAGRQSSALFEDNEFYQNSLAGMRRRGSAPVLVKDCRMYSNGMAGVALDRKSRVTLTGCDVFQNRRAGINVDEVSTAVIEDSRLSENETAGLRIWRDGSNRLDTLDVKITGSRVYRNEQAGIRSMPQSASRVDVAISQNEVRENKKAGIRVENDTRLTAQGNRVEYNEVVGIVSHESGIRPELEVYQNVVGFNGGAGIHVINGVTRGAGIRNNRVFNNHRSGIICGLWSRPDPELLDVEIINNTVVSNGSSGQGAGIRNDSKGRALIMNNIVAYNYVSGIRTRGCGDFSYNLFFANADIGNCCDDPDWAPYWIERLQVAGCPDRGKGTLIGNPLFVDPDNYDFNLREDSPAIDAGAGYDDRFFPPSMGTERNDMGATGGAYAAKQR